MLELVERPDNEIDLSTEISLETRGEGAQPVPVDITHHEEVDVTAELIRSRRIRAEEERKMEAWHLRERVAQLLGNAAGLSEELAHRRNERACSSGRPKSKIPQPAALDQPGAHELLQRTLDGMSIGADASRDLARVQLLPRDADEESQDVAGNAAATDDLDDHKRASCHNRGQIDHNCGTPDHGGTGSCKNSQNRTPTLRKRTPASSLS